MEMEDHQHHHQYSIPDLRQLITGRPLSTHFNPNITTPSDLFPSHGRNLAPHPHHHGHHHYDMLQMVGARDLLPRGLHEFPVDSSATVNAAAATVSTPSSVSGFDNDGGVFGGDGGTGRWPRQETLTLLEIRSRLDPKFKEANQKGPLWDEVSRIMSEEHGYQRSGKKCREKFENLYKYYKKTKEGKAGRQDGKHYRFFRQLEALYGDTSSSSVAAAPEYSNLVGGNFRFTSNLNNNASQEGYHPLKLSDSLSLSNHTSEFDTSSSEEENDGGIENESRRKRKGGGRSWKVKIKEFIDSQMRKLMERQEVWLEKLTKTLEQKEQERMSREEEWRKQDAERIDREHKFWAKERSWIEARDAALMEALQTLKGKEVKKTEVQLTNEDGSHETVNDSRKEDYGWGESEIRSLTQLRSSMEARFQNAGCSEEILWEEIADKLARLGYDKRSGVMCREKWDGSNNNSFLRKKKRVNKIGGGGEYYHANEGLYNPVVGNYSGGSSPSNSNVGNAGAMNDGCFPFLMADGENLWGNYGLKLNKGED